MSAIAVKLSPRRIASGRQRMATQTPSIAVQPAGTRDPSSTRRIIPTGAGPTILLCALGMPIPILLIILMIYFHQV